MDQKLNSERKVEIVLEENDPISHIKVLQDIKNRMNELLTDNTRQIEQMDNDKFFYEECRDLILEVFNKGQPNPKVNLNNLALGRSQTHMRRDSLLIHRNDSIAQSTGTIQMIHFGSFLGKNSSREFLESAHPNKSQSLVPHINIMQKMPTSVSFNKQGSTAMFIKENKEKDNASNLSPHKKHTSVNDQA